MLRVLRPERTSREAPLSTDRDLWVALRLRVAGTAGDEQGGRFNVRAGPGTAANVFVAREWLAGRVGLPGRANVLLVRGRGCSPAAPGTKVLEQALRRAWRLEDAEIEVRDLPGRGEVELRSRRIFLERPVIEAARQAGAAAGVFGYFANELRVGERSCPYSAAAGVGVLSDEGRKPPGGGKAAEAPSLAVAPRDMKDDEAIINEWLAEDLAAKAGDELEMRYYALKPGRKLEEEGRRFRIRAVVPLAGAAADASFLPEFAGLSEAKNCRDWQPGIPIDLKRIRPKDEDYWDRYRGTPKAFVTLRAAQEMWGNRFGELTAVRYAGGPGKAEQVAEAVRGALRPAAAGLYFQDVGGQAAKAVKEAQDFGQLFLGLNAFLAAAALVLTGLLFVFGVEQRGVEAGTLRAVGFRAGEVRSLLLREGLILAAAAAVLGVAGGTIYTRATVWALGGVWRGAVAGWPIAFHAARATLVVSGAAGVVLALLVMGGTLWRQERRPIRELLAGGLEAENRLGGLGRGKGRRGLISLAAGTLAGGAAAGLVIWSVKARTMGVAGVFFGAGSLLLVGLLAGLHGVLARVGGAAGGRGLSLMGLAWRSSARRRGRSLAVAGLLACGSFLVCAVGANRQDPVAGAERRESGTGGFALVADSALPVLQDLNSEGGRKAFGLGERWPRGASVVPVRVHEGDDASCLNLSRAQQPRVLGVRGELLQERGAFRLARKAAGVTAEGWAMLEATDQTEGAVPAVADEATITWGLGKKLGEELEYPAENGEVFRVRLVGALTGSILQGSLIISERQFMERFPAEDGYGMLLIDAPTGHRGEAAEALGRAGEDLGMTVRPTVERLGELYAVQNTYLSIFQAIGGLALLLGSAGLGVVVLRNVLERRGELALLAAVGFDRGMIRRLLILEHGWLLGAGLAGGAASAAVAVWPAVRAGGSGVPYGGLAMFLAGLLAAGMLWIALAARVGLRGGVAAGLRTE